MQDVGLLSYPPHGPLDRMNWVLPFWVDARGQDALLGLPLFWGLVDGPANGAYFQTLSITILIFYSVKFLYSNLAQPN